MDAGEDVRRDDVLHLAGGDLKVARRPHDVASQHGVTDHLQRSNQTSLPSLIA